MIMRNSEVTDYLRCRLRWDYRWNRKLEPKQKSTKLVLGTLFHKFLESYYSEMKNDIPDYKLVYGIMMMKSMYESDVAAKIEEGTYDPVEAPEMWKLLEGLAQWYHEYWSKTQVDTWEVVATEQTYYINMANLEWTVDRSVAEASDEIWYEATLDLVIRINGKLHIVDHKTVTRLEDFIKKTEMDRQISRYLFAANVIFKEEIHGLIYNLIKKEVPKEPTELKKGGLSKAKDQRTTFTMYFNKLVELGIAKDPQDGAVDPETWKLIGGYAIDPDHAEVLQLLMQRELPNGQGNDFLRRVLVKRNKHEMNNAMNEFMQIAVAVKNLRKFQEKYAGQDMGFNNPIYRNITDGCSWDCGYRKCCVAGMDGSDVGYLDESLLEPIQNHYEDGADE